MRSFCHFREKILFTVRYLGCALLLLLAAPVLHAQPLVYRGDTDKPLAVGTSMHILVDSSNRYNAATILQSGGFERAVSTSPIFPVVPGTIWVRFPLRNLSADSVLYIDLQYPNITQISFYRQQGDSLGLLKKGGQSLPFAENNQVGPNFTCRIVLPQGDSAMYFVRINSRHQVLLPFFIADRIALDRSQSLQEIVIGLYIGVMVAIFLYNLFLFFSTRDSSYFIYILYLFFLTIAQIAVSGYGYKYLWSDYPVLNRYLVTVTSALAGISGITFAVYFLHMKRFARKMMPVLFGLVVCYMVAIVSTLAGNNSISYNILNFISMAGGLLLLGISLYIARRKKYKPAYFYFVAWCAFLGGIIVFVLRNINVLPYNNFTTYVLYVGSAIEGILLSIALADKINSLRAEKEKSQADALRISQENERLVKDQNIVLEKRVAERTEELQASNENLSSALHDLKDAQSQLVEAEKMASLGQLTAGIAHEINNPINFVKSNIKPLQLDIKDLLEVIGEYDRLHGTDPEKIEQKLADIDKLKKQIDLDYVKTEIDSLMNGIKDGAERTAEIVLGLRNFSRLDESEIKTADIHEGIDSTLVLLKNQVPDNVRIIRDFRAGGSIECLPGKLNQVFMNIMGNGLQAIRQKEVQGDESLTISTEDIGDQIQVRIRDTGIGMTEEVKQKIFDPFFTTKDVGEGTGLGLSIVFKIIQRHEGKIDVISAPGKGSEFIITLYHTLPESAVN
ncbi:sensor histidine kinase [Sediminibacterium soli]|uniref:sensor histidine kinase n=1 Tax=Sediminibacterium soli TaxID=2698829 RepID=UPI00137B2C85|nr:7TM diverse intracellular signaling domain-containing protein [Sediminibacterium soli]NCI46567.1 hypothetical protein [Sediminibacterium soli]